MMDQKRVIYQGAYSQILRTCTLLGLLSSLSSSGGRILLLRVRLLRIELNQEANPVDLVSLDFLLLARHRSCTSSISAAHFQATSDETNLNTHLRCSPQSLMKLSRRIFCSHSALVFRMGTRSLMGQSPCFSIWSNAGRGRKCLVQKMVNLLSQITSIRSLQSSPVSLSLQSPTQQTELLCVWSRWLRMLLCSTYQLSYFLLLIIQESTVQPRSLFIIQSSNGLAFLFYCSYEKEEITCVSSTVVIYVMGNGYLSAAFCYCFTHRNWIH